MTGPEKTGYAAAVLILVVGGAIVRTVILNWIVGPAIVVVCVAVAQRVAVLRSGREMPGDPDSARTPDAPVSADGATP